MHFALKQQRMIRITDCSFKFSAILKACHFSVDHAQHQYAISIYESSRSHWSPLQACDSHHRHMSGFDISLVAFCVLVQYQCSSVTAWSLPVVFSAVCVLLIVLVTAANLYRFMSLEEESLKTDFRSFVDFFLKKVALVAVAAACVRHPKTVFPGSVFILY